MCQCLKFRRRIGHDRTVLFQNLAVFFQSKERAYRRAATQCHPDKGGDPAVCRASDFRICLKPFAYELPAILSEIKVVYLGCQTCARICTGPVNDDAETFATDRGALTVALAIAGCRSPTQAS